MNNRTEPQSAQKQPDHQQLKVTWFKDWHPRLDEALRELPEVSSCPREMYRLMMQNPGPVQKKIALITEKEEPVALVGLRKRSRLSWEPITQWIVPGMVFPVKNGYILPAIERIGIDVWVAWWRMQSQPPPNRNIRSIEKAVTYGLDCSENYEQYWRDNGYFKTIRRVRNRCKNFLIEVNAPGSLEWVIRQWEIKWRSSADQPDPGLGDRILAAKYLEAQGKHFTFTILDQGKRIGGATITVHGDEVVAGVLYRDFNYQQYGIGDRLIDYSFSFAFENGYKSFDIGGGHHYKQHWAPQNGERWWFNYCPEAFYRLKNMAHSIIKYTRISDIKARMSKEGE